MPPKGGDELALLHAGATCKAMRALATKPELWCPVLLTFFDGELPPALASLEWRQRPLQLLRERNLLLALRVAQGDSKADPGLVSKVLWLLLLQGEFNVVLGW